LLLLLEEFSVSGMEIAPLNKIKMIVIDIDGTLLNPEGEITARTLAAVQAAQQAGIVVTLATARRYCNTVQIARELGLQCSVIVYDGAMIVGYPDATILRSHPLQKQVAQQAVELLLRHHIQPVVHPNTGLKEEIWTGPQNGDNLWLEAYFSAYVEQVHRKSYDMLCAGDDDPLRVVAFDAGEAIWGLTQELVTLDCSWTAIKRGTYGCAEIAFMNPNCSKASGVAVLAQHLNIPLQQVMALGDNNNDIAMLRSVGLGVAMGQASATVKAAAQAVTASNAEDGAAEAIENYALRCAATAASNSRKRLTCL
jgi:5-amino-6-(5-phospho-D-ribitylamino)uracil phosphatase